MTIGKNITVTNGIADSGEHEFHLEDSSVKGSVTIKNGNGDTETVIRRNSPGLSYIGKNLSITNGVGEDTVEVFDTHIGGNVIVKNNQPDGGSNAGFVEIYNNNNATSRSIIGGNVTVSYSGGVVNYDGIWDYDVQGNVNFSYGDADAQLYFDGYTVDQPTIIRGNLTVTGRGETLVSIADPVHDYRLTGLIVGKNLTINTASSSDAATLLASSLRVNGSTNIKTGAGVDTVAINDSIFAGAFNLLTGNGSDEVNIETAAGTSRATQFLKAVTVNLGEGDDILIMGLENDPTALVRLFSTGVFLGGLGGDTIELDNVESLLGLAFVVVT